MKKFFILLFAIIFSSLANAQTYFYIPVDKTPQDDSYWGAYVVYVFSSSKICVDYENATDIRRNLLGDSNFYGNKRYEQYRNKPAESYAGMQVCAFKNSHNNFNFYSYINVIMQGRPELNKEIIQFAISYDKKTLVDVINPNKPFYFKLVSSSDFMPNFNF